MKRKPATREILAVPPLSEVPERGGASGHGDPIECCNVCGLPSDSLAAWREHDEWDRPIGGPGHLVFIGKDHPRCIRAMERHPRLYAEVRGEPGTFPQLCGPCVKRVGFQCTHEKLKANGGPGLVVEILDPLRGAIVCGGRGFVPPVKSAFKCEGRRLLSVVP